MLPSKWTTFLTAVVAASTFAVSAHAAPGPKAHGPKTTTSRATKPSVAKGPTMTSTAPKSTVATVKPIKQKTTTKSATAGPKTTKTKTTTASAASSSTTTTVTGVWTPNNPVAEKLSTKSNLLTKVQNSLPLNTDLNAATAGFKNFGQFIAAVNVSKNLGIPFADLKAAMTGITLAGEPTGLPTQSLGQAIQGLKTGVNAEAEATKAQTAANLEIK